MWWDVFGIGMGRNVMFLDVVYLELCELLSCKM